MSRLDAGAQVPLPRDESGLLPPVRPQDDAARVGSGRSRLVPPSRYRHPGDVLWLIAAGLALLVVLAVVVFLRRHTAGTPKWMGGLQRASPGYALRLGVLLFLAMPSDDLTMVTVGASAARHDLPWWHLLPFVLLTLALLALPLLALLLLGHRAATVLPRIRDSARQHSWVVSEIVIGFFVLMTAADLLR